MVKRLVVLFALCCLAFPITLAAKRRATSPTPVQIGAPLPGLSESLLARFDAGRLEFDKRQTLDDGLGPLLNDTSCTNCHNIGAIGGGSFNSVTRFGRMTDKGVFDPMIERGGPVLQNRWLTLLDGSSHEFRGEFIPPEATIIARRQAPSLFGLGLVDATPDAAFVALAAAQAARGDGTAGRVAMVDNLALGIKTVGKFGWKAQNPTLFQFAGEAYLNEIGITNPLFPKENCRNGSCADLMFNPRPGLNDGGEGTQALTDFMTLLAPPPRGMITADVLAGEAVFNRIGCDSCHVSTLQTGPNEIPALDRVTYHPYSDFLLHDMGPLGDGIHQDAANGREMRTPPLWGLRLQPRLVPRSFLHDGRGRTLEGSIEAHDGQGRASRDGFRALSETERAQLMAFLRSL